MCVPVWCVFVRASLRVCVCGVVCVCVCVCVTCDLYVNIYIYMYIYDLYVLYIIYVIYDLYVLFFMYIYIYIHLSKMPNRVIHACHAGIPNTLFVENDTGISADMHIAHGALQR